MGNREDLLAGARKCLEERGWARTTVRDIAAAAGVSMAAIGYHYGSREVLLTAALVEAMDEWGDRIAAALVEDDSENASAAERYEARWSRLIAAIREDRTLWLANLEAVLQAEHMPELREHLVAGQRAGRRGMAAAVAARPDGTVPDDVVRTVGSVQLALLTGTMLQLLNDPDEAPSSADLVAGIRAIADLLGNQPAAKKRRKNKA
ncbi:TetR/AcrR family transcriptional regulator [Fodinicola acaciae]|uniref:TetR/AcrR family transcriptional regulator n=1 Tax=Fodinicola acaciae TaxID=2681555 RepID=UPI0013D17A67|nr:TetR/AcrR family transcriptional regulator [Fodinicola acaciae]